MTSAPTTLTFLDARLTQDPRTWNEPGWVVVTDGVVRGFGPGRPSEVSGDPVELDGDWLAPGFVDVHVHGGGGGDFMSPDPASRRSVRELHLRHGTTAMLASTVSRPREVLLEAVARLAADVVDGSSEGAPAAARLLGIHLEGPFLSVVRRGAHQESAIRPPDPSEVDALLVAGQGRILSVTLAPELPGAHDLIRVVVAAGVVVSVGHTDADSDQVREAVALGARGVTHTYNAMRPLHHRRPGAVGVAMDEAALTCELILDGIHVHPIAARALLHAAGHDRVCLVTDAMAAAGMPDGRYGLGAATVDVAGGRVYLPGTETLAGSTLTMAGAVRRAVTDLHVDVPTAAAMASAVPARLLDRTDVGAIAIGSSADLVRLDSGGRLRAVWASGRPVADVAVIDDEPEQRGEVPAHADRSTHR